jgi:hypothetical protein
MNNTVLPSAEFQIQTATGKKSHYVCIIQQGMTRITTKHHHLAIDNGRRMLFSNCR